MKKSLLFFTLMFIGAFSFYLYRQKIYESEKDFAHFGLIREGAIYTLLGDKPLSDFGRVKKYSPPPDNRYKEEGKTLVSTALLNVGFTKEDHFDREFIDLWYVWKKRHNLSNKRFAFVCVGDESDSSLYLVNKTLVRKILEKHQDLFSAAIKIHFNIDTVMQEIDNPKSLFWAHMINYRYGHICMGLLFGFGLENTMAFEQCSINKKFNKEMESVESDVDMLNRTYQTEVTLKNVGLPAYRRFEEHDPVLEHYKQERARIQEEYKEADLRQLLIDAFKK